MASDAIAVPIIDVHTHYAPAWLLARLRRGGVERGLRLDGTDLVTVEGLRLPIGYDELHDPAAKLAALDERGVECALISITPHLFDYRSAASAIDGARADNDDLAGFVAADPRLAGLATLPIAVPDAAAQELERAVAQLGAVGAQIGTALPDGRPLDTAGLDPLFEAAEGLDVPLVLHPYYAGPIRDPEYFLNNSIGVPLDTCVAAARLIASGTLDRFPRLRVVLVHGGGFLPYQLGRLDNAWHQRKELRAAARNAPRSYLRRFWFDSVVHEPEALAFLSGLAGSDRVVLGTDTPYITAERRPVEAAAAAGLDARALGANALGLLGAPGRVALGFGPAEVAG